MRSKKIINIRDVNEIVTYIAGIEAVDIIKNIPSKSFINEFKLAEKVEMNINFVRSILYKFYDKKIVEYQRKRDVKKGWYIYYWKLLPKRVNLMLLLEKEKKLRELSEDLKEEENTDWMRCLICKQKYSYERALEMNFTCNACNETLKQSRKSTKEIRKEIIELKKSIAKLKPAV